MRHVPSRLTHAAHAGLVTAYLRELRGQAGWRGASAPMVQRRTKDGGPLSAAAPVPVTPPATKRFKRTSSPDAAAATARAT